MHLLNFNLHEYFQKTLYFILIKQFLFWQKKKPKTKTKNLLVQIYVANSEMSGIQKYFFQRTPILVYKLSTCMSYKHMTYFTQQIFTKH